MLDNLSDKILSGIKKIRGQGKITESNIQDALKETTKARSYFEQLSPSCKRAYLAWIDSAKREETKERRLREAIRMLVAGKKLGLK